MNAKITKGVILGFLFSLNVCVVCACEEISQFLQGAVTTTKQLVPNHSEADYGGINTWFESAEMRYSGSDSDKHDIGFRARPKFHGERAAEHQLLELGEARQNIDAIELLNNELERRYLLLIDVIAQSAEVQLMFERLAIAKDLNKLQRSLAQTEAFDAEDLQDAEFEQMQNSQLLTLHSKRLNLLLEQVGYSSKRAKLAWSTGCIEIIPSIDAIVGHVESKSQQGKMARGNLEIARLGLNLRIAEQKLAHDQSKSSSFIKFLEVKHSIDRGRSAETTFGLSIPFGTDRSASLERERDISRANMSYLDIQSRVELRLDQKSSELGWLLTEAAHLKQSAEILAQQLTRLKPIGQPVLLLRLMGKSHDQARAIKLNHISVLRNYITWLSAAGLLVQEPLVNWLSSSRLPLD